MGFSADDRRKYDRFEISAAARLTLQDGEKHVVLNTRDISAGGAFFHTPSFPVCEGDVLSAEILIPQKSSSFISSENHLQMKAQGTVVRCDTDGMAVKFTALEITPLGTIMIH